MIERFPVWAPGEHGMERRRVYIYLPDEYYEKPKRQYPVLYMFDGGWSSICRKAAES